MLAHCCPNVKSARKYTCMYMLRAVYIINSVFSISCFRDVSDSTAIILFVMLCMHIVGI